MSMPEALSDSGRKIRTHIYAASSIHGSAPRNAGMNIERPGPFGAIASPTAVMIIVIGIVKITVRTAAGSMN